MTDHYRYVYTHDRRRVPRPPWTVRAVLNHGHHGSILSCTHPACVRGESIEPARAVTAGATPVAQGATGSAPKGTGEGR